MAKNGGYSGGHRRNSDPKPPLGSGNSRIVTERNAKDGVWIKRDSGTGRLIEIGKDRRKQL